MLAQTLFIIFFSILLRYAFGASSEGIYIHSRSDGRLFNTARLRSKTKVREILIRVFLYADDAAITSHSEAGLQSLIDQFPKACNQSYNQSYKPKVTDQAVDSKPTIKFGDYCSNVVDKFTYLASTMTSNMSLDADISAQIGKAAYTMSNLKKRVWENMKLTVHTKLKVYQACILSTLLYGCKSWTTYVSQERRLNRFHMRSLRRVRNISWQNHVPDTEVLEQAQSQSIFVLLSHWRLRWLGHTCRMNDGRLPKDLLYGEVSPGKRPTRRHTLGFKDRTAWRGAIKMRLASVEAHRVNNAQLKRARRKASVDLPRQHSSVDSAVEIVTRVEDCAAINGSAQARMTVNKSSEPYSRKTNIANYVFNPTSLFIFCIGRMRCRC